MSPPDPYKRSELHYLCINLPEAEREKRLCELVEAGEDVNVTDRNGWSPLHFAAQESDAKIVNSLIELGADVSATESNGNTPLWVATMNSHYGTEVIGVLLSFGADPGKTNYHGVSPKDLSPELFQDAI